MSVTAIAWARAQECPSPSHKLLLLLLADHASPKVDDPRYVCWPSQTMLVEATGTSESTVRRHLKDLEAAGLLLSERRGSPDGGRLTNLYVLPVNLTGNPPVEGLPVTPDRGVTGQTEGGLPVKVGGGYRSIVTGRNEREPKEEQTLTRERASAAADAAVPLSPEGFAEFWAEYPRKVGKPAAMRAWKAAVKVATVEEIMVGLRRQSRTMEATDVRYRPHPSTWLNQHRWNDQVAQIGRKADDEGWL